MATTPSGDSRMTTRHDLTAEQREIVELIIGTVACDQSRYAEENRVRADALRACLADADALAALVALVQEWAAAHHEWMAPHAHSQDGPEYRRYDAARSALLAYQTTDCDHSEQSTEPDGAGLLPFVRMAHAILGNLSLPLADRVDAAYAVLDKLVVGLRDTGDATKMSETPVWELRQRHHDDIVAALRGDEMDDQGRIRRLRGQATVDKLLARGHSMFTFEDCQCHRKARP
jgi:hypothetical protein